MGSIINGVESLFGGGSANRGAQRDSNNQSDAINNSQNAINAAQGDFQQQSGNSLGWASDGLQNQYNDTQNEAPYVSGQGGIAQTQANAFSGAYPALMNTELANLGVNPNGTAIAGYDPLNGEGNSIIGQYSDKVAPGYDNAETAANHDLMQRGFTGANSVAPSEDADIRRTQASDVAGFGRNLGIQSQEMKSSNMAQALGLITGAGNAAASGYGNAQQGLNQIAQGNGANAGGWENLANSYGAAGNSLLNTAGAWGSAATGWQNGAQNYQNQVNNQDQNLLGIGKLFGGGGLWSNGGVFGGNSGN